LKGQKVLVTGGAGFIGSNLARELAVDNEVTVFDDLSTGFETNLHDLDINYIEGSVTEPDALDSAIAGKDYVFHLAALPSVPRSIKDPQRTHEVNATGTLNVLVAARNNNVMKVVYAASSSAYGDTPSLPKVESMPPNPLSPYAVSKLAGEQYCRIFYQVYGLPTVSLRYFNVYGPKQDPNSEYAAVIPKFIKMIINGQSPEIYGDGEQTRDFTYVDDAVNGTIMACESERANGEVINIAGGKRIQINELAEKLKRIIGTDVGNRHSSRREGDIQHSLADISKAKELLGYEPKYTFDDGLSAAVTYFRDVLSVGDLR
jgi:nucleoside-diphosphate-sugar epimerase